MIFCLSTKTSELKSIHTRKAWPNWSTERLANGVNTVAYSANRVKMLSFFVYLVSAKGKEAHFLSWHGFIR